MFKGRGTRNGQPLLIFGLSGENVARIAAGEPLLADLTELGVGASVLILYGKTEQDIVDQLTAAGMIQPDTQRIDRSAAGGGTG